MSQDKKNIDCSKCNSGVKPYKGRAFDGRRAYMCPNCGNVWTYGMQGRAKKYSLQRQGNQFTFSKGIGHIQ